MKILIVHYFGGGGGKFITNCLSTGGGVAFPNWRIANYHADTHDLTAVKTALLSTIPKHPHGRQWLLLEQGCGNLFGPGIADIKLQGSTDKVLAQSLNSSVLENMWLPVMSHSMTALSNLKKWFNDVPVFTVFVDSCPEFIDLAIRRKWPEEHHCLDLTTYYQFVADSRQEIFDHTIDQWDPRHSNVHQTLINLANHLGIPYNNSQVDEYINLYQKFHE